MWPIDAVAAVVLLLLLRNVLRDLRREQPSVAPDQGLPATAPRRGFLIAAFTLLSLDALLAVSVTLGDAGLGPWQQDTYRLLGVIAGSALLGVAALAWALRCLAVPKPMRSPGDDGMVAFLFLLAFGIAGCYGLMFGGAFLR